MDDIPAGRQLVAIATSNRGKARYISCYLRCGGFVDVVVLEPPRTESKVIEGISASENARNKAISGSLFSEAPVIATDEELFLPFLTQEEQVGALVRRVVGEAATDEQMLAHYERLLKLVETDDRRGVVRTFYGIARRGILLGVTCIDQECVFKVPAAHYYEPGRPLSALHFVPAAGKFFSELSDEEVCWVDAAHINALHAFIRTRLACDPK